MLGDDYFSDAPWRVDDLPKYCDSCNEYLEPHERVDTCVIDERFLCDICTGLITSLKLYNPVADKTKKLVYQRLHEQEFDKQGKVRHI